MKSVNQALQEASASLKSLSGNLARLEAQILLAHVLHCEKQNLIYDSKKNLDTRQLESFARLTQKRQQGLPLAKIIGTKEFWSLPFKTTQDTLDPRPDTETLVEAVLEICKDRAKPYKILDLGTGTGCIILALLHELPNAKGCGIDFSAQALEVASENGQRLGLKGRITWQLNNWCEGIEDEFDIIVSNPPYLSEIEFERLDNPARFDPKLALVSGPTGLECYKKMIPSINKCLAKGGIFAIEMGIHQEQEVSKYLSNHGFKIVHIRKDLATIPRCIVARKN